MTSQCSPGPAAPCLLLAEKAFPIHLQVISMLGRNFLWTFHSKHYFLPLGHKLKSSLAQQGSHVSRSWTLSLSSITLWWGDTATHEGQWRLSVPQESLHKMMRPVWIWCLLSSLLLLISSGITQCFPSLPTSAHRASFHLSLTQSTGAVADPSSLCLCPTFSLQEPPVCLCIQSSVPSCFSPIP